MATMAAPRDKWKWYLTTLLTWEAWTLPLAILTRDHSESAVSRNVSKAYTRQRQNQFSLFLSLFTDNVYGSMRSYQRIKTADEEDLQLAVALEGPVSMAADVQHNTFRVGFCLSVCLHSSVFS